MIAWARIVETRSISTIRIPNIQGRLLVIFDEVKSQKERKLTNKWKVFILGTVEVFIHVKDICYIQDCNKFRVVFDAWSCSYKKQS